MFVYDEFGNLVFVPRNVCFADGEGEGAGGGSAGEGAEEAAGAAAEGTGEAKGAEGAGEGAGKEGAAEDAEGDGKGKAAAAVAEADWRASLSADLKKHAERFTSIDTLVKGHMDLRQQLAKAVVPPGKDADDETVAAYRKATGVPESAEGYKFEMPKGAEATDVDKAFHQTMAETFHGLNISAEQAKGLNKAWNEMTEASKAAQIAEDKQFAEESEAALKSTWGKDFEPNKAYADRAGEQMFGDDLEEFRHLETKDGRFVADHPVVLKALASIGREMGEAGIVPRLTGDAAEQAQDEINSLREKQQAAQAKGDSATANRLYAREQELLKKMGGDQGIVGSAGRAA